MTTFLDEYLPEALAGYPWTSAPRFSTTIAANAAGQEANNQNWLHPLRTFTAPEAIRCHEDIEDVLEHWLVCAGPHVIFPIRDPLDFASVRLEAANTVPTIGRTNQAIGIGDGSTRDFQLKKAYTRGSMTYTRLITLPVVSSVLIAMNALDPVTADPALPGGPYTWDVERQTGVVTFDHAPTAGVIITAGFLFDCPARFIDDNSFQQIVKAFKVDGVADLQFTEVRPCGVLGSGLT